LKKEKITEQITKKKQGDIIMSFKRLVLYSVVNIKDQILLIDWNMYNIPKNFFIQGSKT